MASFREQVEKPQGLLLWTLSRSNANHFISCLFPTTCTWNHRVIWEV